MPTISTYRTPGNVNTDTSGFGGGVEGMDPFFLSLAQRQIAYQDEMRQQQREDRRDRKNEEANARRRERNPPRDPLKALRTAAEASQLHAIADPVPMKPVTGLAGVWGGMTEDTDAYSPSQRKLLLPQNAGMERGGLTPGEELAPLRESASIKEAADAAAAKRRAEEQDRARTAVERAESRGYYGIY